MRNSSSLKVSLLVVSIILLLLVVGGLYKNFQRAMKNTNTVSKPRKKETGVAKDHPTTADIEDSYYTWTGNHWIPPKGVPTYIPSEFLAYFQKRNVLFIGESLARRSYHTMFNMMSSHNKRDIGSGALDSNINLNKKRHTEWCLMNDRKLYKASGSQDEPVVCRNLSSHDRKNSSQEAFVTSGRFDYLRLNCYKEITGFIQNTTNLPIFLDYDLLVINTGIHDAIGACKTETVPTLDTTLNNLKSFSSSKLQIAFTNPGYHETKGVANIEKIIKHNFKFFRNITSGNGNIMHEVGDRYVHNMTLIDWGGVMKERSFENNRIRGDMPAHYDTEARLLFAQQLLHQLVLNEKNNF